MTLRSWTLGLAALAMTACAGDAGGGGAGPPTETPAATCGCDEGATCGLDACGEACGVCDEGAICLGASCAPAQGCDTIGFKALTQTAEMSVDTGQSRWTYRADSRAVTPFERLEIQSFERLGGPLTAGVWPLTSDNHADCALCVLAWKGCTQFGCARAFLADAGTLVVTALEDGRLEASLHDAHFREVYLDDQSLESIPLPNGETWCVERFDASAPLAVTTHTDTCLAAGTGRAVGDKVADFTLTNCLGDPVSLHAGCGETRALWVVLTAGWCTACAAHIPDVVAWTAPREELGVELLVVLGEDAAGGEPSPAYCLEYAAAMGLEPSQVVMDWRGGEPWATVAEHLDLYSDGSLGLPWDGVLDGATMRYAWAYTHSGGDARSAIAPLLSK